jgi:hypothetical protein
MVEFNEIIGLDTVKTHDQENLWFILKQKYGREALIQALLQHYDDFRKWQGRCLILYHSTHIARDSSIAKQIAIQALNDKSSIVRYRACGVLAYSLDVSTLPYLEILVKDTDNETRGHALAAIDAIKHQNHNLFIGGGRWEVN